MQGFRVVALIPAYNEEEGIGAAIEAVLAQDRVPDDIVIIPNGCTDHTAEVARRYPVTVLQLGSLKHKKSEALNIAWHRYGQGADLIISLDADTILPPNAVGDWEQEFLEDAARQAALSQAPSAQRPVRDRPLMGSSAKFTMLGKSFLTRLQRAEFAMCIDQALRRGYTSVLAGAGCALSGEVLRQVAARDDREGPWTYDSVVEDFELTYRLREMGYRTAISPTVRAYTDSMRSTRALHSQRMKWSTGTIRDLRRFGFNRLTALQWGEVVLTTISSSLRILWLLLLVALALLGQANFSWVWWVAVPALFIAVQVKSALRIPHKDWGDVALAFVIVPAEIFTWLRMRWFFASLVEVSADPARRLLHQARKDRWAMQHAAEAWGKSVRQKAQAVLSKALVAVLSLGVVAVTAGAAIPGLGMPNFAAQLNLLPATGQAHPRAQVPVPVGYHPPETCTGYLALTYDDGPTEHTRDLVDTLKAYGLRATFFALGDNVDSDPGGARYVTENGMWIGAHSMTHPELVGPQHKGEPGAETYGVGHRLSTAEQAREVEGSANAIGAATGLQPVLFRPPYGYSSKGIREIAQSSGMDEAFWTLDTNDWQGKTAQQVAKTVVGAKAGDVILMHDDEQTDVDSVPLIAQGLAERGLCTGKLVRGEHEIPFTEVYIRGLSSNITVAKP